MYLFLPSSLLLSFIIYMLNCPLKIECLVNRDCSLFFFTVYLEEWSVNICVIKKRENSD